MRIMLAAAMLLVGTPTAGIAETPISSAFAWPETNPNVIADVRYRDVIARARKAETDAIGRARLGERLAGQARRRENIRNAFGNPSEPMTIDAGTVLTGFPYNTESGATLGVVKYPSGASMTGMFGPDEGIYIAAPEWTVREFSGWVYNARTSDPLPMEGVFSMKSGETFIGSLSGDVAYGVYRTADGNRRFVGKFDVAHGSIQPLTGVVEDKKGRLLALLHLSN